MAKYDKVKSWNSWKTFVNQQVDDLADAFDEALEETGANAIDDADVRQSVSQFVKGLRALRVEEREDEEEDE